VADLLQRTINGYGFTLERLDGYHWLYPFSWFDFQVGLYWTEEASYALIFLIPLSLWPWITQEHRQRSDS
jgi:hypothetical protein